MSWSEVIGQQRVVDVLKRALEQERVSHAYLFHGPDGSGKRAAALALSRALQCERIEPGGSEPCGACPACSKIQRLIHPDVHVYFPRPSDADAEDVAERLSRLARNPYAEVDFVRRPVLDDPSKTSNKQAIYPVRMMNEEIKRAMSFRPFEGRYKIAVLLDAQHLRTEAANAFLKMLEEPSPRTVFILTAERPDRLLPTILSRCQRLRFDPLEPELIEEALRQREGLAATEAALLARMADGSYTRALELRDSEDLAESRRLVIDFLRAAYRGDPAQISILVEKIGPMGRERVKGMFRLMLGIVRDLVLFRTMGRAAPLVNVDQQEVVQKFVSNLPVADVNAMMTQIEHAHELIGRNVHTGLTLTVLALRLNEAMRGRPRPGLFAPLVEPLGATG
jgi:DNA polymerase III subunit delta'